MSAKRKPVSRTSYKSLVAEIVRLERELEESKQLQIHVVQMPDGSPVSAPCAISGCQMHAAPQEGEPGLPHAPQSQAQQQSGLHTPAAAAPDDMCPNCVTPWKCNGPHLA
jgi:hypothetical protein